MCETGNNGTEERHEFHELNTNYFKQMAGGEGKGGEASPPGIACQPKAEGNGERH